MDKIRKQPPGVFNKKGVFKYFSKLTGTPVHESFFNKVEARKPATLSKKGLRYRCFPVNFEKFLRTIFYRTLPESYF